MAKPKRYSVGILRPHSKGKILAEVNHNYKRYRVVVGSEEEARGWIDQKAIDVANDRPPSLQSWEIADARAARMILPPDVSLVDAARLYVRSQGEQITLSKAVDRYVDAKSDAGLRPRSQTEIRLHLKRLADDLGNRMLGSVTTADLIDWLDSEGIKSRTRNNYRRTFRGFWNWCSKASMVSTNPTEGVPVVKLDQGMPCTFRPDAVEKFMKGVVMFAPELVGYFSLGFFAGLRSAELMRLDWSNVGDHIHVGASAAKTRQQRFVTIEPNLADWIKAFRGEGRICPVNSFGPIFKRIKIILEKSELDEWPPNVARHSFATYHLALHQDPGKTAHQLGHHNQAMLYAHYRALATASEATRYFAIRPKIRQRIA